MSAVLRAPEKVPSLFAPAVDRDEAASRHLGVPRPGLYAIASRSAWSRDIDAAIARFAPLLLASIVLLIVGRPLFMAASLAAGVSY